VTSTDWTTDAQGTGQYAEADGINLYVETYGAGRPLILLHGGPGSGEMFGPVLPALGFPCRPRATDIVAR
jgi:pimeloyl-ACP methyl ester carboxylesterase